MGALIFGVVFALVAISKIRGLAREQREIESRNAAGLPRHDVQPGEGQSFSLDQVLAEIQKVKDQAQRGTAAPIAQPRPRREIDRKTLADRADAKRRATAAQRAAEEGTAGPMGRVATVRLQSDPSPEDNLPPEIGAPDATVQAPAAVTNQPALQFNHISIRDAAIWREILSPPLSMRDE